MKTLLRRRGDQVTLGRGIDIIILDVSDRDVKISLPLSTGSKPVLVTGASIGRRRTDYVRYMSGVGHRVILVRRVGEAIPVGDAEICVVDVKNKAAKLGVRTPPTTQARIVT